MAPRERSSGLRVAIVGAGSLKGKELKEVLEERSFPVRKLTLLDDLEALGQLTEFAGEPAVVAALEPETFREHELVFFASTTGAFTRTHWPVAAGGTAAVIDLSHALLDVPEASVRVPFLDEVLPAAHESGKRWYIAPHAAAVVLLALLGRLAAAFPLRQAVANIFEPVSERGAAGLEELQEQTVRLLSFQEFPRAVFDAQVAFNLLPGYGAASAVRLEEVQDIIRREIERRAPAVAERLALTVVQAPVFHAHCLSVLVELEKGVEVASVEKALGGGRLSVLARDEAPLGAVEVAGRGDAVVAPVARDAGRPGSFWLWVAVDNLRLTAHTAVDIAETLLP